MRISDWSSDVCSSDLVGRLDEELHGRLDLVELRIGADRGELRDPAAARVGAEGFEVVEEEAGGHGLVEASVVYCRSGFSRELLPLPPQRKRSEERRVGNGLGSTCKSRWSPLL